MPLTPQKYKFTNSDVKKLNDIGYELIACSTIPFEIFMQSRFPDFNLLALLKMVENQFTGTTNKKLHRTIEFDDSKDLLRIEYYNEYNNQDDALLFIREFSIINRMIQVSHVYCVIPKSSRGNGLIKPVFQESLKQYINSNVKRILVHAGLSGGGYAWAKHGFAAINKAEVEAILNKAKKALSTNEFAVVEKIFNTYYSRKPKGKAFPMDLWAALEYMKPVLMGSDWRGELDLKNKEQFRNFNDYVFR